MNAMPQQCKSGRQDLNLRPFDPQSNALARLRHAPNVQNCKYYCDGAETPPGEENLFCRKRLAVTRFAPAKNVCWKCNLGAVAEHRCGGRAVVGGGRN